MGSQSLKDYLKRYESNHDGDKKKKKKKTPRLEPGGVLVVDEDPIWQKPVKIEDEEENDSADEEKPIVDEDIEVKRLKRLEILRARRPYNAIAEDGSGWVTLSPKHGNSADPNSDLCLPRKQRTWNDASSPKPEGKSSDSGCEETDLSPPRQRQRRHHTPSPEPVIKTFHSKVQVPDLSPPRKRRARYDTPSPEPDVKPSREDADLSLPRRWQKKLDTKPKHSSGQNSDLSPANRLMAQNDRSSQLKLSKEGSDLSPPRLQWRRNYSPPYEVPSHNTGSSDISPPRRSRAQKSNTSDISPRQGYHSSPNRDLRASLGSDLSPPRKNSKESSDPASSMNRSKTGLISGHDIGEEIAKTKEEDLLRFQQMDPSMSGHGAEPVYRNKKGERISKQEYLKSKQKVEEKPKEIKLEWGKGLAQKREAEARLKELELEKEKPFARTSDDPDLDKMLKERIRFGDPMAHLVKRKQSERILEDLGDNEKMKESGFIIPQDIPSHSWIRRGLDAASNRYGIKPGRHWDGVDRSNGFEKQMFKRLNEKQATEKEAYLWSVSDM